MTFPRVFPFGLISAGLALALLAAGCAGFKSTSAQDLAWELWKKCDHFPGVRLKEITPEGQVWVEYRTGSEIAEAAAWKQCMQRGGALE